VLPLKNLMGDAEQEYFVEGMHEAFITELSKIGALRTISRTSTIRYKDTDRSLSEVARELDVDAFIVGSIMRSGTRVRISVQLVAVDPERHLWAESLDHELRDVLTLISDVARAVATQINVKLTPQEQKRHETSRTVNPEAYEFYLRGRHQWNKRSRDGLQLAIHYFQQAIERDPRYAAAYAGLADAYSVLPGWAFAHPSEAFPLAHAAALKALELDESSFEPYATLALIKRDYERDWAGAEHYFKRAIELNPNYSTARHWYGLHLSTLGRHEEALAELEFAERLDPLSPSIRHNVGRSLYYARRYDLAIQQFSKAIEMHPEFDTNYIFTGLAYWHIGKTAEALSAMKKAEALRGEDDPNSRMGWFYAQTGNIDKAQRILQKIHEKPGRAYTDPLSFAMIYCGLGKYDEALKWLERGYEQPGSFGILAIKVEPIWDPLREDPRFRDLLRRMNLLE
jgi:TolB-like protein/Flp pilus assembly protein TadD